jgi:hypothetical protein
MLETTALNMDPGISSIPWVSALPWLSVAGDIGNEDIGLVQQIAAVVSWELSCK